MLYQKTNHIFQLFIAAFLFFTLPSQSQNLPPEMEITPDNHLISGGKEVTGLYNPNDVHKIEFTLQESNWFTLMDGEGGGGPGPGGGGSEGELLIGTLTFNDELVLDSVLIGIKGQTSDFANNSEKKSFKVEIDALKNQDLLGYDNLNLNGGYQDPSGMREILFCNETRPFAPALKAALVDLYINGEYWGPYANVQQIEGTYVSEWFLDNEGTRWRCVAPDGVGGGGPGGPGGGGGQFGAGESTLNYNGADSTDYNTNYTLKNTTMEDPWQDLIDACDKLNNLPVEDLYDELKYYVDVDRALWFLAQEIVFTDEDGYIYKGGMDYYAIYDATTDRLVPLEVDANSTFMDNLSNWSPFERENEIDFPLMNRLMQNNEIRQRYLAHVRVVLENYFNPENLTPTIDEWANKLDERVQNDPKKIYSYTQFNNNVVGLKEFVNDRHTFLKNNTEINRTGLEITDVTFESLFGGVPKEFENLIVRTTINDPNQQGVEKVYLYYGTGLQGVFERVEMFDQNNDGVFEGVAPGYVAGTFVRLYVEAISANNVNTTTFYPKGAEHDVLVYQVEIGELEGNGVVINEIMASNSTTAADEFGEYNDWAEMYNNSGASVDISGFYLSDNISNRTKWQFPEGTSLNADEYLIIWLDGDEEQGDDHADFKLSSSGEGLYFSNTDEKFIDFVEFGEQTTDLSFARIPNATGDFITQNPTFGANNDGVTSIESLRFAVKVFPNPTTNLLQIQHESQKPVNCEILDSNGRIVLAKQSQNNTIAFDLSGLPSGLYMVKVGGDVMSKVMKF